MLDNITDSRTLTIDKSLIGECGDVALCTCFVTARGYTKHYFEGSRRICSSGGGFSRVDWDSIARKDDGELMTDCDGLVSRLEEGCIVDDVSQAKPFPHLNIRASSSVFGLSETFSYDTAQVGFYRFNIAEVERRASLLALPRCSNVIENMIICFFRRMPLRISHSPYLKGTQDDLCGVGGKQKYKIAAFFEGRLTGVSTESGTYGMGRPRRRSAHRKTAAGTKIFCTFAKKSFLYTTALFNIYSLFSTIHFLQDYHDTQSIKTQPKPIGAIPSETYAGVYQI